MSDVAFMRVVLVAQAGTDSVYVRVRSTLQHACTLQAGTAGRQGLGGRGMPLAHHNCEPQGMPACVSKATGVLLLSTVCNTVVVVLL